MFDLAKKMLVILFVAGSLALTVNAVSPRGIPLMGQWRLEEGVVTADNDLAALWMAFELPDPAVAKQVFDMGKALFVDVRNRSSFEAGHIPGALSLPLGELDARLPAFAAEVALDRPIVTYCSGRLCQDSHSAAQHLMAHGFSNVVVFIDGYPGWEAHGYPVERQ